MPTPENYRQVVLTESGNIITGGGRLMYVVLVSTAKGPAIADFTDSDAFGEVLFTLRAGGQEEAEVPLLARILRPLRALVSPRWIPPNENTPGMRVVDFRDVGGYCAPSGNLYALLWGADCLIACYED